MTLTLWQIIIVIVIGIIGVIGTIFAIVSINRGDTHKMIIKKRIIRGVIGAIITFGLVFGVGKGLTWYNTETASGMRNYKDYQSNLENGLEREITITAEDGREIFHYEGKVDIESDHTDNYIKFESEEGKRYIIYFGITDTIIIKEK